MRREAARRVLIRTPRSGHRGAWDSNGPSDWTICPPIATTSGTAWCAVRPERLAIAGDRDSVTEVLGEQAGSLPDDLTVTWIPPEEQNGETGIVSASFDTRRGVLAID